MLDVDQATPFLLDRGLIDVSAILDGGLTIRSVARRNRNLRVEVPDGPGYLIKQPDDPAEDGHKTLRNEAAFYRLCQQEPALGELAAVLPRLAYCDVENAVLAIELIPESFPLWSQDPADQARGIPVEDGRDLGRALGTVHRLFRVTGLARDARLDWLSHALPWILTLHQPGPELLSRISPANYQTLRILQNREGPGEPLDRLRRLWRTETVIHGDIKADNVLVVRSEQAPNSSRLRIVDWEMVQHGDPAWDLAGALQDFLLFWIASMPISATLTAAAMIARARHPLDGLRGTIRALWQGYRAAAGLAAIEADALLARAVAFSAARLIQSAYEISQESSRISARSVVLLQLSANLLADPAQAQARLYGIPSSSFC